MKNTSTKNRFKTRIIAGILSAITIVSVGAATMTSASAAEKDDSIASKIVSTATDFFKDKAFGIVKDKALNLLGSELSKAGVSPILTSFLGF